MPRFLYSLLLYLILPFTPLKLWWRGMRQPEYRQHWRERYGYYGQSPRKPVIWVHCVSVGETRAAEPLIKQLIHTSPQHQLLVTHATPTGRHTSEQLFGDSVMRAYLPYDVPHAVQRFFAHFQPQVGVLMETELWFNLIEYAKQRQLPMLLVNARLSEKSAAGYSKVASLTRQALVSLSAIGAQTADDANRLTQLGARDVQITGNLKFDVTPPKDAQSRGEYLRDILGKQRPVLLAASTRDGEERLILQAIQAANIANLMTIIVPRHPQRFDEVANLLQHQQIPFFRRSEIAQGNIAAEMANYQVMLGDSMGEMFTYYAACDLAIIGGSLMPLGGQNLIEAFAMKKPVIVGMHTFNFEWVANEAIQRGAALRVADSEALISALQRLLSDAPTQQSMGNAAYRFSQQSAGATERTITIIQSCLKAT